MSKKNIHKIIAVCMVLCMVFVQNTECSVTFAKESNKRAVVIDEMVPYAYNSYCWTVQPGQTYLSGKIYLDAGDSIRLAVYPSNSSAPYQIGILQPNGTVRSTSKMGDTVTIYYINTSGYYRIRLHNSCSQTVVYDFDASY